MANLSRIIKSIPEFLAKHNSQRCGRSISITLIRCYQFIFSPLLGNCCRFSPSCSDYAIEAIQRYGNLKGSYFIAKRLIRCHPWCSGGIDPVKKG